MGVLAPWAKPQWIQDADGNPMPVEKFLQLTGTAVTSVSDDPTNDRTVADLTSGGGGGGGYASLTGAGETATPGDLTQLGGFTVTDTAGHGVFIQEDGGGVFIQETGGGVFIQETGHGGTFIQDSGGGIVIQETGGGGLNLSESGGGGVFIQETGNGGVHISDHGTGTNQITLPNLPTADPHVVGRWWSNAGVVTVSAG
jgi:hypothetical protein